MADRVDRIRYDHGDLGETPLSASTWTRSKYVKVLRVMLADYKELNTLLGNKEESDDKLSVIMDLILADFNGDTPISSFRFEDFPNPNCLIQGAMAMALDSNCILQARNALSYTDDGVAFEDFGKDVRYGPLAQKHLVSIWRAAGEGPTPQTPVSGRNVNAAVVWFG